MSSSPTSKLTHLTSTTFVKVATLSSNLNRGGQEGRIMTTLCKGRCNNNNKSQEGPATLVILLKRSLSQTWMAVKASSSNNSKLSHTQTVKTQLSTCKVSWVTFKTCSLSSRPKTHKWTWTSMGCLTVSSSSSSSNNSLVPSRVTPTQAMGLRTSSFSSMAYLKVDRIWQINRISQISKINSTMKKRRSQWMRMVYQFPRLRRLKISLTLSQVSSLRRKNRTHRAKNPRIKTHVLFAWMTCRVDRWLRHWHARTSSTPSALTFG